MTEKRFDMSDNRFYIKNERTIKDSHKYTTENGYVFSYKSDAEEVCNLLNKFYEENRELKKENEELEKEAEIYNEDAMSYQTLYEQQVEKNKKIWGSEQIKRLNIPQEQIDEVVLDEQLRVIAIYYKKENPIIEENKKRLTCIFLKELKEALKKELEE